MYPDLNRSERAQVSTILKRRANEIAIYSSTKRELIPASVDYALELEINRLRTLAEKIDPPVPEPDDGN